MRPKVDACSNTSLKEKQIEISHKSFELVYKVYNVDLEPISETYLQSCQESMMQPFLETS